MLPWILAAFVAVPIAETAVFIEAGGRWGLWPTVGAVFGTAVLGSLLIRRQGLSVFREVQGELDAGRFPALQMFDGLCLLIAGAALLTPGFLTDALGFALLIPWPRRAAARALLPRLGAHMVLPRPGGRMAGGGRPGGFPGGDVIDGDYADITGAGAPDEGAPPKALR